MAYELRPDAAQRRASALLLARTIVNLDGIVDAHRRELLGIAIWKMTEANSGKRRLRYQSRGALEGASKTNHEHVFPKKWLIDLMLDGAPVDDVMNLAVACTVSVDEHRRLTRVDPRLIGWERYLAAAIDVMDVTSGQWVDIATLAVRPPWLPPT